MVTVKPKNIVAMKMSGAGETHARTRIKVRDVIGVIDEPEARGGTNLGLTPTETLMAALVGCTNVITSRIAEKMHVEIADLAVELDANFDRRGSSLTEEIDVPFPEVKMHVSMRSNGTPEQIEEIKRDLARFCPVAKVIRASGTRLDETWTVEPL
jgi:putative redox protein